MRIQERISLDVNRSKIDKVYKVMLGREEEDVLVGRSDYDSPEVDPAVLIRNAQVLTPGEIYLVQIEDAQAFELYGKALLK